MPIRWKVDSVAGLGKVGFYQRCVGRICETVDRGFEPATLLTKVP
jgi:hypothetical protein